MNLDNKKPEEIALELVCMFARAYKYILVRVLKFKSHHPHLPALRP